MQLDNDQTAMSSDPIEVDDLNDVEKGAEWLLQQDMSDPVEKLFSIQDEAGFDLELSEAEAEMAGRPMFRGHGMGDDISSLMAEDIVAVDVGAGTDIYAESDMQHDEASEFDESLWIDHGKRPQGAGHTDVQEIADGTDIFALSDSDDIGESFLTLVNQERKSNAVATADTSVVEDINELHADLSTESEIELSGVSDDNNEAAEEVLPPLDLTSDFDFGGDLNIGSELDLASDPDMESGFELSSELESSCELESSLEPGFDSAQNVVEADQKEGVDQDANKDTVLDYVASTPAPVDDAAFDEYLLKGESFASGDSDEDYLTVEDPQGVVLRDPAEELGIDYHEDFEMMEGFKDDTVSAITLVISQVMQELTSAVEARLVDFDVDSETIVIDVLLGNDVDSIIQCVTDGYLPIVDIQPQLPAALRQLGQSEVDAIYVRLSHPEIKADWNRVFNDDFSLPGASDGQATSLEIDEPQPFAAFDLDEFDFDGEALAGGEETFDLDFDANMSSITEFASDDPLASIEFAAVGETADSCDKPVEPEKVAEQKLEIVDTVEEDAVPNWCVPADIQFSTTGGGNREIFSDFLDAFIEEANSELEKLEDAIGVWEGDPSLQNAGVPASVTHTLHNLKGIAKGVGLQCYGTLIHNYETLLDALAMPVTSDASSYFRIVNAWLDSAIQGFEHIESTRSDVHSELPAQSAEQQPATEESVAAAETVRVDLPTAIAETASQPRELLKSLSLEAPAAKYIVEQQSDKQLADEGAKTLAGQQSIRMSAEAMDDLLNLTNQAQQLGVRSSESTVRSKLAATELLGRLPSIRAHIARIADRALSNVNAKGEKSASTLDALEMDQYSELQEAANILRESVEDLDDLVNLSSRQASTAEALLKQQAAVISSLGSSIQAARVIPVSRLIPGLRRIVRTVGADLGKTVALKVLNQVGTLDRDNHARCQVILEHMVRNAMDHGIESPQDRLEQGKPASGTITIDVKKQGADYIITLSDDGRGVDPAMMRETAYRKDLDVDVDSLTDDEAIKLMFHKGFSTAAQVSEISGRGVGMDIVLSELKQIGGDIEIDSVVGRGTHFHIRIPPNVSVNGALLVAAGERSYAIPLDGLIAVDNVDVDDFFAAVAEKRSLSLFGMECEPAYLATLCHGDSLPKPEAWNNTVPVMIAGSEDRYMAIAVDDVKQALELVIRSLGVQFSNVPGVAGATTTVDGQAVVALDLNALVGSVEIGQYTNVSVPSSQSENLLVLVVDDSRTQRMVSTSQLDTLGVETITAENGMVAIDLLNTTHRLPDVILLDVEMPVKDGIQTLREIRKSFRYSDIPVIMVTSRTGAKHRALADEAGCNGYMGKPFNFPILVEKIAELTGYDLQLN